MIRSVTQMYACVLTCVCPGCSELMERQDLDRLGFARAEGSGDARRAADNGNTAVATQKQRGQQQQEDEGGRRRGGFVAGLKRVQLMKEKT